MIFLFYPTDFNCLLWCLIIIILVEIIILQWFFFQKKTEVQPPVSTNPFLDDDNIAEESALERDSDLDKVSMVL